MKERPILMSAPMVRAILAGTKTVTRRIVNPLLYINVGGEDEGENIYQSDPRFGTTATEWSRSPYGVAGDRLWVRETWQGWKRTSYEYDEWEALTREARSGATWAEWIAENGKPDATEYRATSKSVGPWTPAIHMPRWASRITLEIVDVRVERLHDITDEDAKREGVQPFFEVYDRIGRDQRITDGTYARDEEYRASFACLWDEINGDRAPWSSNPWVWRVAFRRIEQPLTTDDVKTALATGAKERKAAERTLKRSPGR